VSFGKEDVIPIMIKTLLMEVYLADVVVWGGNKGMENCGNFLSKTSFGVSE
jgi:hypothetical protein